MVPASPILSKFNEYTLIESRLREKRRYYLLNPALFTKNVKEELWKAEQDLSDKKHRENIESFWDLHSFEQNFFIKAGSVDAYTLHIYNKILLDAAAIAAELCGDEQQAVRKSSQVSEPKESVQPDSNDASTATIPNEQNAEDALLTNGEAAPAEEELQLAEVDPEWEAAYEADDMGLAIYLADLIERAERVVNTAIKEAKIELGGKVQNSGAAESESQRAEQKEAKKAAGPATVHASISSSSQSSTQARAQTEEHDEFDV